MNKESRNSCIIVSFSADVLDLAMKNWKCKYNATLRRDQIVESWTTRQSYDPIRHDHTLRNCAVTIIGVCYCLLKYFLQ